VSPILHECKKKLCLYEGALPVQFTSWCLPAGWVAKRHTLGITVNRNITSSLNGIFPCLPFCNSSLLLVNHVSVKYKFNFKLSYGHIHGVRIPFSMFLLPSTLLLVISGLLLRRVCVAILPRSARFHVVLNWPATRPWIRSNAILLNVNKRPPINGVGSSSSWDSSVAGFMIG
jgi:hypothetical protein